MGKDTAQWLRQRLKEELEGANVGDDCFKEVSTLGRLPQIWVVAVIVKHSKMTTVRLSLAIAKDPLSYKYLVSNLMHSTGGLFLVSSALCSTSAASP